MVQFATELSAPDLSKQGAAHITEGVENYGSAKAIQATTGLIKDVGTTAIAAKQGYDIAQQEIQSNALNQEYMDRRSPQTIFSDLDPNAVATGENISPMLQGFNQDLSRYQNAIKQGIMTPWEFELRVKDNLRKAVNNNPGMIGELTKASQNALDLSGLTDIVKQDHLIQQNVLKQQEHEHNYYMQEAGKFNIPLPRLTTGQIDYNSLVQKVSVVQQEKAVMGAAEQKIKWTEDDFRTFGTTYAIGLKNIATKTAIDILNDPNQPLEKSMAQINMILDSVSSDFIASPKVGSIIDKPPVQSTIQYLKDQMTSLKATLKSFATKEEAMTFLKNMEQMSRSTDYITTSKVVNPEMVSVLNKLLTLPQVNALVTSERPDLKVQIYDSLGKLIQGVGIGQSPVYTVNPHTGKSTVSTTVESLAKDAGKPDQDISVKGLQNLISAVNGDTKSMSLSDRFNFNRDYIKTLGLSSSKEGLSKIDDLSRQHAVDNINDYTTIIMNDMKKTMNRYKGQGIEIPISYLPDGRINIGSSNPTVSTEMNKKYVNRINDSLSAYSNLNGYTSTKEASKEFYNQYKEYLSPPQTTSGTIKKGTSEKGTSISGKSMIKVDGVWEYE